MTEHGTYAGYNAHYSGKFKGEPVCRPCRDAANKYTRDRRTRYYLAKVDSLLVDGTGTKRRIQALHRMGWPLKFIGERLAPDSNNPTQVVWSLLERQERVHIATRMQVEDLYRELSTKVGPDPRAQRRAIKKGWAPPAAWDDIDDPMCKPQGMTNKEIVA